MTSRIRAARKDREWSQTRLIAELERAAQRQGRSLPTRETLKSRVSRWENGHSLPDEFYRRLLREAFGMDDRELGLVRDEAPRDVAADDLQLRLMVGRQADGELLEALRRQTDSIRVQDRQFGAGLLLEQMRVHVRNVQGHLSHAVFDSARRPLAGVLADAAALAGWQALDVGGVDQAWRSFEVASAAARQAEDPGMYAFARLEQAHVLAEMDRCGLAADLGESVWREVHGSVAPPLRCWAAAATAELLSVGGRRKDTVRMMRQAESEADALEDGERPPYLVFDLTHLERWMGHTLVQLQDPAAELLLRRAATQMDESFIRASAALTLDLAAAVRQRDERAEADELLDAGETLARRVGSRRQLKRAQRLRAAS